MGSIKDNVYNIIKCPRITEKSTFLSPVYSTVVFEVHPKANKVEIAEAIESLFDVKVKSVRTVNYFGKVKKVRSHLGRRGAWKKAYVSLSEGKIDLVEGL